MRQSLVILGYSFPHFPCTKANDGIEIRVVVWRPMKYLYAEGALFQVVFVSRESLFHDVPEQLRIALTCERVSRRSPSSRVASAPAVFRSLFWGAKRLFVNRWSP
jgi:hypothetical protein